MWEQASAGQRVRATKDFVVNFSKIEIYAFTKSYVEFFKSRSYLTSVTTAEHDTNMIPY